MKTNQSSIYNLNQSLYNSHISNQYFPSLNHLQQSTQNLETILLKSPKPLLRPILNCLFYPDFVFLWNFNKSSPSWLIAPFFYHLTKTLPFVVLCNMMTPFLGPVSMIHFFQALFFFSQWLCQVYQTYSYMLKICMHDHILPKPIYILYTEHIQYWNDDFFPSKLSFW
jgi:hypothetical protein